MKISAIRSLACIGCGAMIGLFAAQRDLISLLRADDSMPAADRASVAGSAVGCANNGEPSKCCYPPRLREDMLTDASTQPSPTPGQNDSSKNKDGSIDSNALDELPANPFLDH